VVTSSFNAVFPEGIMVGVIDEVKQDETLFYDVTVKLAQDFRKLSFVEVVRSHLRHEQDSLQAPFMEEAQR
jgi:rod shape-determining protein MreC